MSSPQRNFWIAFSTLGALTIGVTAALPACSQAPIPPQPETQTAALQTTGGATLNSITWYLIAPDGTVRSQVITPVPNDNITVSLTNLAVGTSYQLILSGVTTDGGVVGCSGSTTFTATSASQNVGPVMILCSDTKGKNKPDSGVLVQGKVNICPVIDGVSANPSSAAVGATMALGVLAHDPDSGPAVLSYSWSASGGGSLAGGTTSTPTFTCSQAGTVTLHAAVSDGDAGCGVNLPFTVTCTGS
jgi:hypothetical protein